MSAPQTRPAVAEGEAAAAGRCTWATCRDSAVDVVEGWPMCALHKREHYALQDDDRPRRGRKPPAERAELIRALHSQGKNDVQIAKVLGVDRSVVQKQRRDMGLSAIPTPRWQPIRHGTKTGAQQHYRRGDAPCRACLDAQAFDKRVRKGAA